MPQINFAPQTKLIFTSALFFLATLICKKPIVTTDSLLSAPAKEIKYFSVGLKINLASALWMRVLENSDYCEQKINQTECIGKSWLFQNLDLATDLDPIFEAGMYRAGALALTIIISDYAGASIIFDRGVLQYPKDWSLLYAAAYHAHFEEKKLVKASELYFAAAKNGAPDWIHVMAGRLAAEGGNSSYAEKILQTMIDTNQDEKYVKRLREKLLELKK
jgi:hypothetical protein